MKPIFLGDLIPSKSSITEHLKLDKGIKEREFYEDSLGGDFNYPDW